MDMFESQPSLLSVGRLALVALLVGCALLPARALELGGGLATTATISPYSPPGRENWAGAWQRRPNYSNSLSSLIVKRFSSFEFDSRHLCSQSAAWRSLHCWSAAWRWHCSRPLGAGGLRPLGAGATMARVSGRHLHMHIHICMYVAPVLTWTCSNRSHLCSQSAAWRSLHCWSAAPYSPPGP